MNEQKLNGWILLNKDIGISSAHALNKLKRIVGKKQKIGHAGTLDPFASGLLIVGLGEATKLMDFAVSAIKSYTFTITWGEDRDTLDVEGVVTNTSDARPTRTQVEDALQSYLGDIMQIPPAFSAISINGERAYKLAREGKEVKLAARAVALLSAQLLECNDISATISIVCSKGFYVRSLARDIAHSVGTCGYVSYLHRTRIGNFDIKDALSLEQIENGEEFLQPIDMVLDGDIKHQISEFEAAKLKLGQCVDLSDAKSLPPLIAAFCDDKLIALCDVANGQLKPKKVFNL